jgi:hypothetical protein
MHDMHPNTVDARIVTVRKTAHGERYVQTMAANAQTAAVGRSAYSRRDNGARAAYSTDRKQRARPARQRRTSRSSSAVSLSSGLPAAQSAPPFCVIANWARADPYHISEFGSTSMGYAGDPDSLVLGIDSGSREGATDLWELFFRRIWVFFLTRLDLD